MQKKKFSIVLTLATLVITLSLNIISALPQDTGTEINFEYEAPINYSNIVINETSNQSEYWNTNVGSLDNINSTQFENNEGTLSIINSWLTSIFYTQDEVDTELDTKADSSDLGDYVPYSGATQSVYLGSNDFRTQGRIYPDLGIEIDGNNYWNDGEFMVTSSLGAGFISGYNYVNAYDGNGVNILSDDGLKLHSFTDNGFLKTSGGDGTVSVDTTDYAESSDLDSYVPYTGATGNIDLGSNDLYINGNVGIGTDSPLGKLHISGSDVNTEYLGLFAENGITPGNSDTMRYLLRRTVSVQGDGAAYFMGRDVTNDIEFVMGTTSQGAAWAGSVTSHDFQFRTNNNNKWIIKNSGGHFEGQSDNQKLLFGAGQDASIYYDGTDLIIDPKEVGTGDLVVKGNVDLESNDLTTTGLGTFGTTTGTRGDYSFAAGEDVEASGDYSTAMGIDTQATNSYSTSMGRSTKASGIGSTAMGGYTIAMGNYATAMGYDARTSGYASTAMGYDTRALGSRSIAMGEGIIARGENSVGIGLDSGTWDITQTNTMAIMGGNVGIGTISPGEKLEVNGNSIISGALSLGSNTQGGLNDGDINASEIFYDTLTAKSPMFLCSDDWCSVEYPNKQKRLHINKENNWSVNYIVYEGTNYTKTEFWNLVKNTEYEELVLKLNKKINKLQNKYLCENEGYKWDGSCYEINKISKTYEEAVEKTEVYNTTTIETNYTCTKLNETDLTTYETTCTNTTTEETDEFLSYKYEFKENCNWNKELGYYCNERNEVTL